MNCSRARVAILVHTTAQAARSPTRFAGAPRGNSGRLGCTRAGIEGLRLHHLRREVGSRLLECVAPLHEVRDVLGHANVSMTSRYLKSSTTGLARTLDRLVDWKGGGGIRTPFTHEPPDDLDGEIEEALEPAESGEDKAGSSGWIRI